MSLISQDGFRTSIFNYCTGSRLSPHQGILSIFVDRCQFKSISELGWKSVSISGLHLNWGLSWVVKSDMWHCHVERSLNVTLGPGSQMAGRKSMVQTWCGAWRVEMDLGQQRVMQAVNNQSIISFKGKWNETWWKYCVRAYSGGHLACKYFDLHL